MAQNPQPWRDVSGESVPVSGARVGTTGADPSASLDGVHSVKVSLLDSTEIRFFNPTEHVEFGVGG